MMANRTAVGSAMMVSARLFSRMIDLVTMMVLARLLQPIDFGIVAIAASLVAIVESALDLPLNQALVRLEVASDAHYDTAFTIGALRACGICAVLLLASQPFAAVYGDHRLASLVQVLTLGALARGIISPRLAEFQKSMSFWRDFAIEVVSKAIAAACGIGLGLLTHSYWSIAVSAIMFPATAALASYVLAPYRPRYGLTGISALSGFIGWMSLAQIISALNWQSERLFLGKMLAPSKVGLFTAASDLSQIPMLAFFGPITRPLLAAFSKIRVDRNRLAQSYQMASAAILTVGVPLLVGESLLAEPLVRVVLGERWISIVPLLQWLTLSVIPALFALAAIPLCMALGQTRLFALRNAVEIAVKLPIMLAGFFAYGLFGFAVARFVSEAVAACLCIVFVRRMTGLSALDQLAAGWRGMLGTVAMVPAVLLVERYASASHDVSTEWLNLLAGSTLGAAVYGAVLLALWHLSGRPRGLETMAISAVNTTCLRLTGYTRKTLAAFSAG